MEQQVKEVPYGVADFAKVIEQNLYYVDKTMFLPEIEKQPRNLFFIRPRRFGKSLLISTLKSYYLGKKELFKGLAIEGLEKDWKTYPVFHLDFGIGTYTNANALD